MKIVASTKLTRAQRAMNESKTYGETSKEVFDQAETKPLEGDDKKTLIVVCSSDKGLCGGVHSGLSRYIRRLFAEKPNAYELVILGEKCKAQLSRTQAKDIQLSFAGVGKDVPTFADAQAIADQIVNLPHEYASIKVLYNKFINAQSYEPTEMDAFSEEAIKASRMCLHPHQDSYPVTPSTCSLLNPSQKTSLPSRSTKSFCPTCRSTLWPTPSTGVLLRVTLASSLPAETLWT
jgi:ATP synthase F1 gamma subunit